MSDERRYGEQEVEEILDLAAKSDENRLALPTRGELTLSEVQEIGQEAGISPAQVEEAALTVEARRGILPTRKFIGMPISVGRVVDLPRDLTDREWDLVVSDLRSTFDAPGEVRSQGGAREWANGSLRVLLEPSESGSQLRFTSLNRRLRLLGSIGVVELVAGLVFLVLLLPTLVAGGLNVEALVKLLPSLILAGAGAGFIAWAGHALPKWALERDSQMEMVGARVKAMLAKPQPEDAPG
ncbi:MAG: hypothetical protein ACR2QM_16005 [Longimicrobiales bacterium]